jgi:STE24 endopeptidase
MYFFIVIGFLLLNYFVHLIADILNLRALGVDLPDEFKGYYDPKRYADSQAYLKENTLFGLVNSTVVLAVLLTFIVTGFFNLLDIWVRGLVSSEIGRGLLFIGVFYIIFQLIDIPFSAYRTFIIEEKYGFNKMTLKTFFTDLFKSWLLTALIAGGVLALVIWFFIRFENSAWLYCWAAVAVVEVFLIFIAPAVIMPIFNKFTPLDEGELKTAIQDYARAQNFRLKGIFTMDGSRRSAKSNAFFTGIGKYRRIVLFDTLIAKHTVDELVSVLAHEVGHYKRKHILKHILISVLTSGMMFFILSLFINNPRLFAAFKMDNLSVYASLLFFSFLYTPINMFLSIVSSLLSRRHEYEADSFAIKTYRNPGAFIEALKKLTVDNLSNLTPHPLKVFLEYSHPPVIKRIAAIRRLGAMSAEAL